MKIRYGFVSNSSSSSFIISLPKTKTPCPTCGHCEQDILAYFYGGDNEVRAKGKADVIAYFSNWYNKKEMKIILDKIEKYGDNIAVVSCDNCNETLRDMAQERLIYDLN